MNSANSRSLFGTDGIRGKVNTHPMTAEIALSLGRAAGIIFRTGSHRHSVVIGKDTRLSGYMFESALQAGLTSMGVNCLLVGPMPTPAVAFLTRALRADAGIMLSASHNPFYDNGIKIFGPAGMKLDDDMEREIERVMAEANLDLHMPEPDQLGRAKRLESADGRYIEFCKNCFPRNLSLVGLRVVVDCANGAAYKVAPAILRELGAEVIAMGDAPNGININDNCGAMHPRGMQEKVRDVRADLGLAFDGDADRLVVCDDHGQLLHGDALLALLALEMNRQGTLKGGGVVATVMSNLGLERLLAENGLSLARANVGDRYVLEHMVQNGYNLGGEQSGHTIFLDHNTTGDGIISALKVLEIRVSQARPLSRINNGLRLVPQLLRNVDIVRGSKPLELPQVQEVMERVQQRMASSGRILVRPSGTEPKIRVMVEGDDPRQIEDACEEICLAIRKAVGMI
ncbi:MAG: phosphoglucosamine mutase [Magnetococcales bacterium]|nr:phosphoglucosamine mutase [Magnetococcales bacterium]NGZ27135.1 phosphoglucosamine mutase [Magnetococcales bacterium]